jgi:hypothetical protein
MGSTERKDMKTLLRVLLTLFAILFVSGTVRAQTPVVGSHIGASGGSVTVTAKTGDLLLTFCSPYPSAPVSASDSVGDVFTSFPTVTPVDGASLVGFWARAKAASTSLKLTCTVQGTIKDNQIYAAVVSGGGTPFSQAAVGSTGKAAATISSLASDLVLAFVEDGSVSNASGWTALSTYNSNLLASKAATGATSASFTVTGGWNLLLVDVPVPVVAATISVSVSPTSSTIATSSLLNLSATVTNDAANAGVTWSVSGGGSILATSSTTATFTAPILSGTSVVTATSVTDTTKSATSTITVVVPPDTTSPIVSIQSPGDAQNITGIISVFVSATDNVGVTSVQVLVDGAAFGSPLTVSPYTTFLDTANLTPGPHTISATAVDSAGNVGTSTSIGATVVGELFDITLLYDDGTPFNAGGTVSFFEFLPNSSDTQSDVQTTISASGNFKVRWTTVPSTVYLVQVVDPANNLIWHTGTELTPAQVPTVFQGVTAVVQFYKATSAWAGFTTLRINY